MIRNLGQNPEVFQRLLNAAPDPMIIVDREGRIVHVNQETERQFGYPRSGLVGLAIEVLLPESYRERHIEQRNGYFAAPRIRAMGEGKNLLARRMDGSEFPVEISLSPLQIGDDLLIISSVRDISSRRRHEEELARSNSELEQFAYVASHDLQEPLRSITGSVQLLERKYKDKLDPEALEFIGFAVESCKRMQQLINDLLAYSRLGTKANDPKPLALNDIVTRVRANLRARIEETGAVLTVGKLPIVTGDQSQMIQLFQNLIGNGIKFRRPGVVPEVQLDGTTEGSTCLITVRDNGIGIDPKYFDRIFVLFKRLHTRDEYPGTGIGLATAKKIVERHGGTISVESTPGMGTCFTIHLPVQLP